MEKNDTIEILLIDDDEEDYLIIKEIISQIEYQDYTIQWVSSYEKALMEMKKGIYHVFLIDYNMGVKTGLDLIDELGEMNRNIPIIILTGLDDYKIDTMAMEKGASDFLCKGKLSPGQLERSIRYAIEKKKAEKQIFYLAYYDALTNLPNRIFFTEQLKYALAYAIRYKRTLAVMFLDLDNFKLVNDSLGHNVGDLLLKEVAQRLCSLIRKDDIIGRNSLKIPIDTVARLGGDEFTISLTEINTYENASIVAERIIKVLNKPFFIEGHEIYTGVSIGISLYPTDSNDADTLLKYADNAMYYVKKMGKNGFQYCQKSMNDDVTDKIHIMKNLRKAGEQNEFLLYYQPKMCIESGKLIGLEALIRWNNKEKGIVPPKDFIPFAEKYNLIGFITDWVIHEVCRQLVEWNRGEINLLPVSINVPVIQFKKHGNVKYMKNIIDSYNVRPELLELELTESIFMDDMKILNSYLNEFRSMGFHISIDDFGMGFSSLNQLKHIACDTLKIDRSFIMSINENTADNIIINSIISIGHGLNMEIIAEGVETGQQFEFLSRNNCDSIQGYLLSPPLPKEKIPGILKEEAGREGLGIQLLKKMKGVM
ncbi:MAG: EAL domain-containing protein [Spirochaetales bacterium]|nr:EAL domain-containing protein [Spirochaetales bacterium]